MIDILFKSLGGAGILLISLGILSKDSKAALAYLAGGICLEAYSLYLGDVVFIILQAVFTCVAAYKLVTLQKRKK